MFSRIRHMKLTLESLIHRSTDKTVLGGERRLTNSHPVITKGCGVEGNMGARSGNTHSYVQPASQSVAFHPTLMTNQSLRQGNYRKRQSLVYLPTINNQIALAQCIFNSSFTHPLHSVIYLSHLPPAVSHIFLSLYILFLPIFIYSLSLPLCLMPRYPCFALSPFLLSFFQYFSFHTWHKVLSPLPNSLRSYFLPFNEDTQHKRAVYGEERMKEGELEATNPRGEGRRRTGGDEGDEMGKGRQFRIKEQDNAGRW